jgi:hypothetical protein
MLAIDPPSSPALIFFFDGAILGKDDSIGQIDEYDTRYKEPL